MYIKHIQDCSSNGVFQIFDDRRKLGYLIWDMDEKTGVIELCDLMISEKENRQQGLGSKLIKAFLTHADHIKAKKIFGVTQEDDYPVHDFYRKHGFHFTSAGEFTQICKPSIM